MDLTAIQTALGSASLDGWLFYDHHNRDPLAYRILGLPEGQHVTRRWYYLIPAHGEPKKLVHRIESGRLDALPGTTVFYSSWQELEHELGAMLNDITDLALQYSPRNAIMYVSMVDAGTVELLRDLGKRPHSSANLIAQFEAVLTDAQIASHYEAQERIDSILAGAWIEIADRIRSTGLTDEFSMVAWLNQAMAREGIVWEHGPNVSAGPHSADSHYEPTSASSRPLRAGDFVLIDIWGRMDRPGSCFYDITWTGVIGREPTQREQTVFEAVRDARDAAVRTVSEAFAADRPIAGFEADDAARHVLIERGFAEAFTHRTGHNIGNILHGAGAHLDNLETHDERLLLPNTCFSVEPGVYFPHGIDGEPPFGVRAEVNVIATPGRAVVSGRLQNELVRI